MTLAEKIEDAEKSLHNLQTGKSARVVVDQNGERVEFTPANSSKLAAYIADLKRQNGSCVRGPLKVWL